MGNPDLSPPETDTPRGLVVFSAAQRARRRSLGWYAPFLVTVALGAIVVVAAVLIR